MRRNRPQNNHGSDKRGKDDLLDKAEPEGSHLLFDRMPCSAKQWGPPLATDFRPPPYLKIFSTDIRVLPYFRHVTDLRPYIRRRGPPAPQVE